MNLALVADWLTVYGGAEHAIEQFLQMWPKAPLFTTVAKRGNLGPIDRADIRTTRLQNIYRWIPKHQVLLARMPQAVEEIDLKGCDVIVSSSHAVAKGIVPPSNAVHICYCHTPMRYAWEMEDQYLEDFRIPRFARKHIKRKLKQLRRWDLSTAKRVDQFIANSTETQERIQRIYGRESIVIPPPVSERFFETPLPTERGNYYLAAGRLVPYKRFDLLIELANARKLPLKIAGTGQEESCLKQIAGPTVEFLGFVPDDQLPSLYANAKALLFPQYEDAGIVPLEAQACGTPVIAYGKGGALDTIVDGKTGIFFAEQSQGALSEAIDQLEQHRFDPENIRAHAKEFSATRFRERIAEAVDVAKKSYTRTHAS
jgi:glycosyltransferase involved in cell wall biosynthesis